MSSRATRILAMLETNKSEENNAINPGEIRNGTIMNKENDPPSTQVATNLELFNMNNGENPDTCSDTNITSECGKKGEAGSSKILDVIDDITMLATLNFETKGKATNKENDPLFLKTNMNSESRTSTSNENYKTTANTNTNPGCSDGAKEYDEIANNLPTTSTQQSRSSHVSTMDETIVSEGSDDDSVKDPDYDESASDSSVESDASHVDETEKIIPKSRKRQRQEKNWKINIQRNKVNAGLEHESKGKIIGEKTVRPPCNVSCRLKCSEKICEEVRKSINSMFWHSSKNINHKRQYVASNVKMIPISRKRTRTGARKDARDHTRHYYFEINGQTERVCKMFFHNTLNISQTFVTTALKKKEPGGIVAADERGRHEHHAKIPEIVRQGVRDHIMKFPVEESHYSRERTGRKFIGSHLNISKMYRLYKSECEENNVEDIHIAKEWLYADVFNKEFNLSFKPPDNDTCDQCDCFLIQLRETNNETEKQNLQHEYDAHLEESSKRYNLKKQDKLESVEDKSRKIVACVDLEKCLPTPVLTNSQSFYTLKLWTYNYTIFDVTNKLVTCVMWDETKAGRGANEMASGMYTWALKNIRPNHEHLIIWSDNCPSQNRNIVMVMAYFYILKKIPTLKIIEHKFLLRGHTHLEVDSCHSLIEREKKKTPGFQIVTPWDWQQIARMCSISNPFKIINMETEDFKDFKHLYSTSASPFISRKKDTSGNDVSISKMVLFQIRAESFGTLFYKTSFDEQEFSSVDLIRTGRRATFPEDLPNLRDEAKAISTKKYNHLQTLLKWVPKQFHDFYKNISHTNGNDDD